MYYIDLTAKKPSNRWNIHQSFIHEQTWNVYTCFADNIVTMIIEPTNLDLNVIKISIIRPRKTLIAKWKCWLAAAQFVIFNLMKNISGARRKMLGFLGLCNLFRWRKIVISFIHFFLPTFIFVKAHLHISKTQTYTNI